MLQLVAAWNWLKRTPYYIFGVFIVVYVYRLLSEAYARRAVKRSVEQGHRDMKQEAKQVESAESDWVRRGKKTDEI